MAAAVKPTDTALHVNTAGNVAALLTITNQTINLGGHPAWIQALTLAELNMAERRLRRASIKHEGRALLPLLGCFVAALLVMLAFSVSANAHDVDPTPLRSATIAALGLIAAIPVWAAVRDIRRRHIEALRAADRRWAEIVIEIALRSDGKAHTPPAI